MPLVMPMNEHLVRCPSCLQIPVASVCDCSPREDQEALFEEALAVRR